MQMQRMTESASEKGANCSVAAKNLEGVDLSSFIRVGRLLKDKYK